MTTGAADALVDVYAVIEIDEVRQVMNSDPLNRLIVAERSAHGLQIRTVSPDLRVTVHAGLCRRHPCRSRLLYGRVAVAAINAVVAHVMLVAELYRLRAGYVGLSVVAGAVERRQKPEQRCSYEDSAEDAHPRDGVGALMKYLGHDENGLRLKLFSSGGNLSLTFLLFLCTLEETQQHPKLSVSLPKVYSHTREMRTVSKFKP